ncbi:unnamed protein product [Notodromas monacha]|uniref:Uncharacterized protein n=1 Tax=Notodromas monacha TaxID=399045 RepID=A0A7R9BV52_9CRUS|nr:unnamed protein product [Notodromas monacha]CAG0920798.1 unnamed protein product [Notodromas monacha]
MFASGEKGEEEKKKKKLGSEPEVEGIRGMGFSDFIQRIIRSTCEDQDPGMTEILPHLRTSGKTEKLKSDLNCGIPRSTAIMEISEDKDEIFGHKAPGTSQNLSEKRKSVCREHNYPGEGGSGNISPLAKFSSLSEKRRVKRVRSEGSDFSSSSSCDSSPVAAALKIENYEGDKFQIEASSWMKINARIRKEEHAKFRELCRKAKETLFPERASQLESKAVENKSVIRKLSTVQEPGILSSLLSKGSEVTYLCRWKLEKETVCKYVDRDDLLKCCPKAIEKFSVGMHESEGVIPTSRNVKVEPAGTAEFNSPYEDNEENVEVPIRKRRDGPGSQGDPKRRRAEERALSPPTPLMSQALTPPPPWQFNAFPKMNPQHLMALMQYRAFLARTQQGLRASMM